MANVVEIAGAGLAGLAAAITLARAGRRVVVHEATASVGSRFRRDLQGLENWTTDEDVLDWLARLGLPRDFAALPCRRGTLFDWKGRTYAARSSTPIFYMIERGGEHGSLDDAMLRSARELGVEVRFGSRLKTADVLAAGPQVTDAIAVGYHFDTPMHDGFWLICDDAIAPQGYAYLLVMNGRGTVKSCMFSGFARQSLYVQRTVAAFERRVGLRMRNARRHGGVASFRAALGARADTLVAGEQAGAQDALWGFGMRLAIASGVMAARSLIAGDRSEEGWRCALARSVELSHLNRSVYERVGNRGYAWLFRGQELMGDSRRFLRWLYTAGRARRAIVPWLQPRGERSLVAAS